MWQELLNVTENLNLLVQFVGAIIFKLSDSKLLNLARKCKQLDRYSHHLAPSVRLQMQFHVTYR